MDTTLICIGGGELKDRTTLKIDEYIAAKAKARAGERRANALFLPTASHDFMPYYNTFHKVYTGLFDIKTDVALCVYREPDLARIQDKFEKADMIYVGGGDTVFMMNRWKETGLLPLIRDAYNRGVILCGLSAGAICWFSDIYTDSAVCGEGEKYAMYKGLGWIKGKISPHYAARSVDFDKILCYNNHWNVTEIEDFKKIISRAGLCVVSSLTKCRRSSLAARAKQNTTAFKRRC